MDDNPYQSPTAPPRKEPRYWRIVPRQMTFGRAALGFFAVTLIALFLTPMPSRRMTAVEAFQQYLFLRIAGAACIASVVCVILGPCRQLLIDIFRPWP